MKEGKEFAAEQMRFVSDASELADWHKHRKIFAFFSESCETISVHIQTYIKYLIKVDCKNMILDWCMPLCV